jgi:hypothetical protein
MMLISQRVIMATDSQEGRNDTGPSAYIVTEIAWVGKPKKGPPNGSTSLSFDLPRRQHQYAAYERDKANKGDHYQ